jgi:hypothetical protein
VLNLLIQYLKDKIVWSMYEISHVSDFVFKNSVDVNHMNEFVYYVQ